MGKFSDYLRMTDDERAKAAQASAIAEVEAMKTALGGNPSPEQLALAMFTLKANEIVRKLDAIETAVDGVHYVKVSQSSSSD